MRNMIRAIFLSILMAAGSAWAAETGYVHAINGDVTITRAGQPAAKAKLGDLFEQGASFVTGADGTATLKFADGQVIALAPRTQFAVTSYNYNAGQPAANNILFNLVRGGSRFVTGLIGQTSPSKFGLRTPTLTAGVRGTDGVVVVGDNGATVISVSQGTVTITTSAGTIVITQGNYAYYAPGATSPTSSGPVSSLPPEAQALLAIITSLQNTNLPPSNPVDVIQAAKEVVDNQSAPGTTGNPSPTPGPSGGGGGGTGASPS